MTVKELKDKLDQYDESLEIFVIDICSEMIMSNIRMNIDSDFEGKESVDIEIDTGFDFAINYYEGNNEK